MTLTSSRRGTSTLELHEQAITCIPYHSKLVALEKDVGMDFDEMMAAIVHGVPVPGTELRDEQGQPIPGTARLKQKPRLLIDVCFHTQVGSNYTKDQIGEWLLGNQEALSQEPNVSNLARFIVGLSGGDYDAMVAKAKEQLQAEKKEMIPSTSA